MLIGGTKVIYVMQSCKPSVKWDGMTVVLEGINVPAKGDLQFSVGKVDFSDKAIRELRDTIFFYDGLLTATCQTLVRLEKEESVERYSMHRDKLLRELAETLSELERSGNESAAIDVSKKRRIVAETLGAKP